MNDTNRKKIISVLNNELVVKNNLELQVRLLKKLIADYKDIFFTQSELTLLFVDINAIKELSDIQLYFVAKTIGEIDSSLLLSENCNIENLFSADEIQQYEQRYKGEQRINNLENQKFVFNDVLPLSKNQWMCRISIFELHDLLTSGRIKINTKQVHNATIRETIDLILNDSFSYTCLRFNIEQESKEQDILSYNDEKHTIEVSFSAKIDMYAGRYESIAILRLFEAYNEAETQQLLKAKLKDKYFIINLSFYGEKEKENYLLQKCK